MKFMDYGYYIDRRSRLIKIFNENKLNANFIKSNSTGIININENDSLKIKVILSDYSKNETQINPIVRLHPKRQTKVFDPINFKDQRNFSIKSLKEADVFCIDYPTTSFAYVNATNKPVIFFDLGTFGNYIFLLNLLLAETHCYKII